MKNNEYENLINKYCLYLSSIYGINCETDKIRFENDIRERKMSLNESQDYLELECKNLINNQIKGVSKGYSHGNINNIYLIVLIVLSILIAGLVISNVLLK